MSKKCLKRLFIPLGKPKSGKGTLLKFLGQIAPQIPIIGVGEVCRAEIQNNSEIARAAQRYMEKHQSTLWPSTELFLAFGQQFENHKDQQIVVADGLLRKPDQVPRIISLAEEHGFHSIVIIHVDTTDDECAKRPVRENRSDDELEEFYRRLGDFGKETIPAMGKMLSEHSGRVDLVTLDGEEMMANGLRYANGLCCIYGIECPVIAE